MDPLPVFVVYAKRPFLLTSIQHAAASLSGTDALIVSSAPLDATEYEDTALAPGAPPNASETIRFPRLSKSNPKGVSPSDGGDSAVPARPSLQASTRR